jgi:hypothetical protein
MKVTLPVGYEGTFVDGTLDCALDDGISQDGHHLVIAMTAARISGPAKVYLHAYDLSTIVQLARDSKVQAIRDAVI